MARIVAVHGIYNTFTGPQQMAAAWGPALLDGIHLAGGDVSLVASDIAYVAYGDLYRPPGRALNDASVPWIDDADLDEYEIELLEALWNAAAQDDPGVPPPEARTLGGVSRRAQAALAALACSRRLAMIGERMLKFWLRQVRLYFTDEHIRAGIQARFAAQITGETQVVVAHSLGSVVAYEALCAHPEWGVTTLVTIGSPLGIRNLIFDRLRPPPLSGHGGPPTGVWPDGIRHWVNIADADDVVALVKTLRSRFGDRVVDIVVDNGAGVHNVVRYLAAAETGAAIAGGLSDPPV